MAVKSSAVFSGGFDDLYSTSASAAVCLWYTAALVLNGSRQRQADPALARCLPQ